MRRLLFLFFFIASVSTLAGCPQSLGPKPAAPGLSKKQFPVQSEMDLGVVVQGTSTELRKWVSNASDSPMRIAEIKTSCECLQVRLSQKQIDPQGKFLIFLHYDGAKEPDFAGSLLIEVELLDDQGQQVGRIEVPIEVVKPEAIGEAHQ